MCACLCTEDVETGLSTDLSTWLLTMSIMIHPLTMFYRHIINMMYGYNHVLRTRCMCISVTEKCTQSCTRVYMLDTC